MAENTTFQAEENIMLIEQPIFDPSDVAAQDIGKKRPEHNLQDKSTEDTPPADVQVYMNESTDHVTDDLAGRTAEPSASRANPLKNLPDEMIIITDQATEKPQNNVAVTSTARPLVKPVPFAQRRGAPLKSPTAATSLATLKSQPRPADNESPSRSSSLCETRPAEASAKSLSGSIAKPKPQPRLGPARRPKKPVDLFLRRTPARKIQDGTAAKVSARATTTSVLSKNPSTWETPADVISTKRDPIGCDDQRHDEIEIGPKDHVQPQDILPHETSLIEGPTTSEDHSNNKRVKVSLLASTSITSALTSANNEAMNSASIVSDAPALFEERALQETRIWTPVQDLTEDQVIKQVHDWLFTGTQFYHKVDDCTMLQNFGAFADFDFE
ncbi:hypothetical protein MMC18_000413 [Xylographa bjoerkii]|nr:hypothetical protein [Xylographa bjoerkii]